MKSRVSIFLLFVVAMTMSVVLSSITWAEPPNDKDWTQLTPVHHKIVNGNDTIVKAKGPVEPPNFWWSAGADQIWFHGESVAPLHMTQLYQRTEAGDVLRELMLSGVEVPIGGDGPGLIKGIPRKQVTYGAQVPGPGHYEGEVRYPINPGEWYSFPWEHQANWFHAWRCQSCETEEGEVRMRICFEPQFNINLNLATSEVLIEGESLGLATITYGEWDIWSADFFVSKEYYDSLNGSRWTEIRVNNPEGDFWYEQMFYFDGWLEPCN